jgi:hypothetical protein
MLFLAFPFSLKGWTILKSVQPLLETVGFIKSWARAGKEGLNASTEAQERPTWLTVSDSLVPLFQGQSHRPLSWITFPFPLNLFLFERKGQST